jgi:hypothetical protein
MDIILIEITTTFNILGGPKKDPLKRENILIIISLFRCCLWLLRTSSLRSLRLLSLRLFSLRT